MSTSATDKRSARCAFVYLLIAIFVAFFGAVYEHYSHGVYSYSMLYAFAYPLIGGTMLFSLFFMCGFSHPPAFARNAWHSGVATLTVGSIVKGVLEIYGTDSSLRAIYTPVGVMFLLVAVMFYILKK